MEEILNALKDVFRWLGQHPAALVVVVLVACFTLLGMESGSSSSKQD